VSTIEVVEVSTNDVSNDNALTFTLFVGKSFFAVLLQIEIDANNEGIVKIVKKEFKNLGSSNIIAIRLGIFYFATHQQPIVPFFKVKSVFATYWKLFAFETQCYTEVFG
jgi:hypothetical protein